MNSRQLRRAQERKQSRDREGAFAPQPNRDCQGAVPLEPAIPTQRPVSPAQLAANRANAQLSSGPTSPTGKAKSSLNAVKTGLTGRTVLLPGDDAAQYEQHVRGYFDEFKPAGDRESALVQGIADTQWRLGRIPSLEMGIYAVAQLEFKDMFQEEDPAVRAALIQAQTFITYQRQLNNLSLQEARLRRNYQKDLAELTQLQAQRVHRETTQPKLQLPKIGFEFPSFIAAPVERHTDVILSDNQLPEAA